MAGGDASRQWLERSDAIPLGAVASIGLAFFSPALAGRWPVLRDVLSFTFPSRAAWREALLAGHLPQWNPRVGLGLAMTAAPVNGSHYPGHALLLLGDIAHTLPALLALHAVLAGVGAYVLARAARCGATASAMAALGWMLGGYAVSMWGNGEKVLSGAWVPFAAAGIVAHMREGRLLSPRLVLGAAALALTALAGDPFLWLDTLLLAVPLAWAVARDEVDTPLAATRRVAERVGAALALGTLLSAPALLPPFLLRDDTRRAVDLDPAVAEAWSMHPIRLVELIAPGGLGDPVHLDRYPGIRFADNASLQPQPWALSLYCGAACVFMPFAAGKTRATFALVGSAFLGLLEAVGHHTPVHAALRWAIVPMRWMRYPEKHALVLVAALTLLGALGCDRMLERRELNWRAIVAVAVLAAVALALGPSDLRQPLLGGTTHVVLGVAALVGALWLASRRPAMRWILLLVSALDLGWAAWALLPWSDGPLAPPQSITEMLGAQGKVPARLLRPRRGHTLDVGSLPGSLASVWGFDELPGHDPARSVRLDRLAFRLGTRQTDKLVRVLRLDWAFVPDQLRADGEPPLRLIETRHGPRAWVVGRVQVGDDEPAIDRILAPDFDPESEATIAPSATSHALSSDARGACDLVSYASENVELECRSDREALVVLAEAEARGWTAAVDGAPVPIERANTVERAVWIPGGTHRVTFAYETPGRAAGLGLGAVGIVVSGVVVAATRRRRLRTQRRPPRKPPRNPPRNPP
jgi:hypothetical protein